MAAEQKTFSDWKTLTHSLGKTFAKRAEKNDELGEFVNENYSELKAHCYFSILVPKEFGGAGLSYEEVCQVIRIIGYYCGSTALAFSMHQHLVAATVWKHIHKGEGGPLLQKVVDNQLVLVSTGARDWLASNGEMEKVDGGYIVNGKKHFASQSAGGDLAITSAPYYQEDGTWKVLHFSVPLSTSGVFILDDWHVMSMRSTGSQTIEFKDVFVPESSIALERPRDEFHPVWNLVITVAMPLIMSAYVGIAEKAQHIAIEIGKKYGRNQKHLPYIIGKMNNNLLSAQTQWKAMYERTNNFQFNLEKEITGEMVSLKTNTVDACIATVSQAMEAIGGQSIYKKNELERLFRDVQAGQFHPMPKWDQYEFTGSIVLGK
ncbi:acyl-CoA dehydrogenase family protein [Ekhidna sp. To15]|uniref:acyl-CoA dehydrogenase family protein n=1 Tax=Ekhidna sp. To15 TaxID=3395267 RepID=UPI003F5276D3